MIIDPAIVGRGERNALINGLIAPRPIAWVSSLSSEGAANLAPFSFFGAFSFDPPVIGIGPGSRQGTNKDSLRNIKATGEFVVNLVNRELAEVANACSGEFGPEVDEWEVVGLRGEPSAVVAPQRVAEAPAALECRVMQVLELGTPDHASNNLVVAWIQRIHVRDDAIDGYVPRPEQLDLVARMGGDEWCTTRDRFTLPRPGSRDPANVARDLADRRSDTTGSGEPFSPNQSPSEAATSRA
ncbi:MAG: flavin reductase family protein [Actinomycetota bacterium]|nr:flavin reductase family protein [Actinomycetota bacterium]